MTAELDGDDYVLNGRKYWPCNVAGWDGQGADVSIVVARTDPGAGGTSGLSAFMLERGTPGVSYTLISKIGHRLTPNAEIVFDDARVPAANLVEGTARQRRPPHQPQLRLVGTRRRDRRRRRRARGVRGGARLGEDLHGGRPGADHPLPERRLRARRRGRRGSRPCRYFCWKTAHYLDQHDYHGELIGAMCKVHCTELLFDAVYKCMQVVGVNSVDRQHMFEKYLREATILPLYDAGNFGMQRRRVHGVIAHPDFNPRALMDDEAIDFTKEMETIDTVPGHLAGAAV